MALLFARLQADVPLKLRRGAWYRVLELDDLQAVIEVNHRKVGVLRAWLEIQQRPPQHWTIVTAPEEAHRKAPPHLRGTYAVCPNCRARAPLPKKMPRVLECARCRKEFEINSANGNGVKV
ncbi:MAG TPA: hypothetical protein VG454_05400 [Gemmatimonadales bacterium]|nr:hypothetical protein [Gemmatimonadales bacterium]